MPLQAQGEFAQVKNRLEPALSLSGQPVKRGTMAHKHIIYMMLVDSAVHTRDKASILEFAPILEELAINDDHQPYLAVCHRAFGVAHRLADEFEPAEIRLQKALGIFEKIGAKWQSGRTLFELGALADQRGNDELARELYNNAVLKFEELVAFPEIEKIKTVLK